MIAAGRLLPYVALLLAASAVNAQPPDERRPQQLFERAVADFRNGHLTEAAAGFEYYVGRYNDCRIQFESHRTVNPNDVENAAWHFLCVARAESPEKARAALLPVGPDARVPMRQIYQMFRGSITPEVVLASAGDDLASRFYADLYVGLYFDALGKRDAALEHIQAAAADRYAAVGGYMFTVAQVHLGILRQPK